MIKKNILITGAEGQLGLEFQKISKNSINNLFFTDIHNLDITQIEDIEKFIIKNKINYIINCAAYTAVDDAEVEKDKAYLINCLAVENIASISKKYDIKLVHISTDYVFDGENNRPYLEFDKTEPKSIYGLSKLKGETEIFKINCDSLIIRTSWLYSNNGKNFFNTIKKLSKEREFLNVVFDQIGTPTYAYDLATAIMQIIDSNIKIENVEIYHFSNEGVCSWYDFAVEINKLNNSNCIINPILSNEFPTKAQRPKYSVLDKNKIKNKFGIKINHWRESLLNCYQEL